MKYKIVLITVLEVALFYSCKKDRECKCSVTRTSASGTVYPTTTKIKVYEDATRRKAKTLCKSHIITSSTGSTIEKEYEVKFERSY
jgi:hypothetical protein